MGRHVWINPKWPWRVRLENRIRNAFTVRFNVLSRAYLRGEADLPRRYGFAYKRWDRTGYRYVLRPFHLLARFWHWYVGQGRWCIEKALIRAGVLWYADGDWYWNVEWSPPSEWRRNRERLRNARVSDPDPRRHGFGGRPGIWGRFWRTAA